MKAKVYNPLPPVAVVATQNKAKEGFFKPEKAEDSRFNQNLPYLSVLRNLSKLFGGLISIQDAINALKKEGFDNPEELIKKLMDEGKIYEPKNGFLSVLGD